MFTPEERAELIRRVTADIPNVAVMHSDKLLADFAREQGSSIIIKGLRAVSDFEREFQMALMNHKLNPGLDTMFLTAEHQFMYLSSSAVKELARSFMRIAAFAAPINAFTNASYFTLRSGGKTVVTFLFDSVYAWGISVPLACCLVHFTALPIVTVYLLCQAIDLTKCTVGLLLVRHGSWATSIVEG